MNNTMNTLTIREDNLLNLNSYNKPVYYLISQEFYTTEVYDVLHLFTFQTPIFM